jgi:hypothetical protein
MSTLTEQPENAISLEQPKDVARCEHVKFNGTRCGSPAMRNQQYCYHHARIRQFTPSKIMPMPDSIEAINYAASGITHSMFSGDMTPAQARVALAALRLQLETLHRYEPPAPADIVVDDLSEAS